MTRRHAACAMYLYTHAIFACFTHALDFVTSRAQLFAYLLPVLFDLCVWVLIVILSVVIAC